jgi:hypothetical protein
MDCSDYCHARILGRLHWRGHRISNSFWIGIALLPVAGIAGKVLGLMGYGKQK